MCLSRWDDMAAKPPAGGTNTISTESEITTTELLKRREVGIDGLRSEFLVRKIVVPLGVPEKPKGKLCSTIIGTQHGSFRNQNFLSKLVRLETIFGAEVLRKF